MNWGEVYKIVREIEEKAQRQMERGVREGTPNGVVQAQLALGCKYGMQEIKRRVEMQDDCSQRAAQFVSEEKMRPHLARKAALRVEAV